MRPTRILAFASAINKEKKCTGLLLLLVTHRVGLAMSRRWRYKTAPSHRGLRENETSVTKKKNCLQRNSIPIDDHTRVLFFWRKKRQLTSDWVASVRNCARLLSTLVAFYRCPPETEASLRRRPYLDPYWWWQRRVFIGQDDSLSTEFVTVLPSSAAN